MKNIKSDVKIVSVLSILLLLATSIAQTGCVSEPPLQTSYNINTTKETVKKPVKKTDIVKTKDSISINISRDTIKTLVKKADKVKTRDSSSVLIFSKNGKLVRELKFPVASEDDEWEKYNNCIKGYPTADTITGDFNGDGKKERAWFKKMNYEQSCNCQDNRDLKSCRGIIQFSDKAIKRLVIDYCPTGNFKNEGDLNGDKCDEIGVLPGWFSSGCRYYHVFTYRDSTWIEACDPIGNTTNMRVAGIMPIKKGPDADGYTLVQESLQNYYSKDPKFNLTKEYEREGMASCAGSHVIQYNIKMK